jgi:hypothetical protein
VDGPDWAGLREPTSWKERAIAAEAEVEKLRADLAGYGTVGALAYERAERITQRRLRMDALRERNALQARLDAMGVEWGIQEREFLDGPWDRIDDGSRWSNRYGKRYTREEAEAEVAKRVNGIDPKLWRRLVSRLVGPWTVVPEDAKPTDPEPYVHSRHGRAAVPHTGTGWKYEPRTVVPEGTNG